MRLLLGNADGSFSLASFTPSSQIPRYAILSHTWETNDQDITFQDITDAKTNIALKSGYRKLRFCYDQARKDGLDYFWIDSCCIDQRSSAEVSQVVNSMFRLYRNAAKCYVYLADVSTSQAQGSRLSLGGTPPWASSVRESRWFTRGWTLQELLAPRSVEFFSCEGVRLGDRKSLETQIHRITGIPVHALQGITKSALSNFSVSERMAWAEKRKTTIEEDKAYCLLGIFDIHMPLIYGEGEERAFIRLQDEIDRSLDSTGFRQANWTQEERKCLQMLHSADYQTFKDRLPKRLEGTCRWFFNHESFKQWQRSQSGLLWLSGKAQCGKSVLAKSLIDTELNQDPVYYFFFQSGNQRQNSASTALSAILHQLFLRNPPLMHHALPDFAFEGNLLAELFPKLWNILLKASADSDSMVVIFDGLDQCKSQDCIRLLRAITQYYRAKSSMSALQQPKIKFLLTSRSEAEDLGMEMQMETLLEMFPSMHIQADTKSIAISRDIDTVIKDQISSLNLELFRTVDEAEQQQLEKELLGKTHDTYQFSKDLFETIRGNGDSEDSEVLHHSILNNQVGMLRILIETGNALQIDQNVENTGRTPLSHAAEKGYLNVVKQLLESASVNLESTDSKGQTPLYYAARYGRDDVVRLLLKAGANSSPMDQNCRTPLLCVSDSGMTVMVKMLLDAHADVNVLDTDGQTALSHAVQNGSDSIVKLLVEHKANLDTRDEKGQTPLSYAVEKGNTNIIRKLLKGKAKVNLLYKNNETVLVSAVRNGDDAVVAVLLEADGIDVNSPDIDWRTPLSYAAEEGHEKIVSQLLATGLVSIDGNSRKRRTPLSYAAEEGHAGVVSQLLATEQADITIVCDQRRTPLSYAAEHGSSSIVAQLLATGRAEVDLRCDENATALMYAARNGHHEIVSQLIGANANVNSRTGQGSGRRTALSFACQQGHIETVRELLKAPDIDISIPSDFPPLRSYKRSHTRHNTGIMKASKSYTSRDVYQADQDYEPIDYARESYHTEIVELLIEFQANRKAKMSVWQRVKENWSKG